jgi:hypothetical protein
VQRRLEGKPAQVATPIIADSYSKYQSLGDCNQKALQVISKEIPLLNSYEK